MFVTKHYLLDQLMALATTWTIQNGDHPSCLSWGSCLQTTVMAFKSSGWHSLEILYQALGLSAPWFTVNHQMIPLHLPWWWCSGVSILIMIWPPRPKPEASTAPLSSAALQMASHWVKISCIQIVHRSRYLPMISSTLYTMWPAWSLSDHLQHPARIAVLDQEIQSTKSQASLMPPVSMEVLLKSKKHSGLED